VAPPTNLPRGADHLGLLEDCARDARLPDACPTASPAGPAPMMIVWLCTASPLRSAPDYKLIQIAKRAPRMH
jgi:hypothetical protein